MCSERYALLRPFLFLNTQLPPTRSLFSKHWTDRRASVSALTAVSPHAPAPMTATRGRLFTRISPCRLIGDRLLDRTARGGRCRVEQVEQVEEEA